MRASRNSFESACCSGLVALGLVLGCRRVDVNVDGDESRISSPSPSPSPSTSTSTTGPSADPYLTADPVLSRSLGHTSYVLKLSLEGGAVAVFKPRSRLPLGDHRYKGEIAAYRLATALGLDNVPRAIPRAFDAATLRALQGDFDQKGLVDADGRDLAFVFLADEVDASLHPALVAELVRLFQDPATNPRRAQLVFNAFSRRAGFLDLELDRELCKIVVPRFEAGGEVRDAVVVVRMHRHRLSRRERVLDPAGGDPKHAAEPALHRNLHPR